MGHNNAAMQSKLSEQETILLPIIIDNISL